LTRQKVCTSCTTHYTPRVDLTLDD